MNTRAAGRGTTTAGIAVTTDAVTTVAAAGERGRQGTRRGVIYQPGYTLTKSATFPENRTTSVSRLLTGSSTVPFHRGGRCFVRLPVSRSLTGSSTVPVHREGGSRQRMSGPSTMSHPALWTCPACGRPLTVALNPEGGEAGAHRPLEISRASAAAHACTPAARFPQFHSASSSSSITGYEPASCQPWQPPVSAGAEDDEGVISQSEYTLTKPSSCPNHRRWSATQRTRWLNRTRGLLKRARVDEVITALRELCRGRTAGKIRTHLNYFLKNRHRFAYTTMVGLGLPRGSGAVESAIRRVINLRIKGASIYWLPESVDAILLLRSFYKSGRWNCLQRMAMTPVGVSA